MELLLGRFRNLTVLVVAIFAQLALLAYQIKSNQEVRLIRVWAVSAVTPMARLLEGTRSGVSHFFGDYFMLRNVRDENNRLKADLDKVKMENQYLRTEVNTADRAKTLAIFQKSTQSTTLAAHVIGNTTGSSGKVVFVDRGGLSKVEKGMAVITPDGIVGKVISVYPTASQVMLITDPAFAAGVISEKHHVHGTLKGKGYSFVIIDYIQNEMTVDQGERFYTSGDDRIFPKGLPVGVADVIRAGVQRKEIDVTPSGLQNGLEDVLIVMNGVHAQIPEAPPQEQNVHLLPPPPADTTDSADSTPARSGPQATDADRLVEHYRNLGAAQKHSYGDRGSPAPNYNLNADEAQRKAAVPETKSPGNPPPHP
jgi:rod shape-determining protein MreC